MGLQLPAPPYYGQLFLTHADGQGMSEVYWLNGASYQEAIENLISIATPRLEMMPESCFILHGRVSDSTKKRDTKLFSYSKLAGHGTYNEETNAEVLPQDDALLVRIEAAIDNTPYFSLRYLHCVPEDCSLDGSYSPTAEFLTAFDSWKNLVMANCKMVTKQPTGDVTANTITDITVVRMSERKAGRPFGLSAGRSRRP